MKRLLIVEKEPRVRQLMRVTLERVGYDVTEVSDADAAWPLILQESFDLIVVEELVRNSRRENLLALLESEPRTARTKVLVMTSIPANARLSDLNTLICQLLTDGATLN